MVARSTDEVRDEAFARFARWARAITAVLGLFLLARDAAVPPGAPSRETAVALFVGALLGLNAFSLWRSRQGDNSWTRRTIEVSLELLAALLVSTYLDYLVLFEVAPGYLVVAAMHAGLRFGLRRGVALVAPFLTALLVMRIAGIPPWVVPAEIEATDIGMLWPPAVVIMLVVVVTGWTIDQLRAAEAAAQAARQEVEDANQRLQQTNAALSGFARTIAHDLRSPLTAAAGSAELVRDRGAQLSSEQLAEVTDTLARSARRASELVGDMLELAHGLDQPQLLAVSDLRAWLLTLLGPVLAEHDATLEVTAEGNHYELPAGPVRAVILNLVTNAIKHGSGQPRVRVTLTKRSPSEVRITVDDDGPGIRDEDWRRLLQHGERGATAAEGTGHGLAAAHQTVAGQLRGTLELGDSPLGGTRIVITVPSRSTSRGTDGTRPDDPS